MGMKLRASGVSDWSNDCIWSKQQHSHLFQNFDGVPNLKKGLDKHPLPKGSGNDSTRKMPISQSQSVVEVHHPRMDSPSCTRCITAGTTRTRLN